ncbi:hypothetical protein DIS24_g911 [Lasiodiplodia hormozganensis]|uniref:Imidazoleglycerol-phosphate dehydratase n=2 Tax=Lasiodiplodia TaxID=66739 RepID=A0A5N5DFL8_9PEZI|nr:Imidazoleglycerol-phosphate dehydratase [Lasiodiplodia theobromae]KAB2576481.1 hypothetical protein DBV05_g4897 [Lasiodiplodia theobromae]KAF4546565.1 Imidazoleglycerol-phosphate dehydratase [Lasiodiplodia theobromae]KAK0663770.1 hypothetical protein DIS24_g911 [Lasiodiplodia hormozganensis]
MRTHASLEKDEEINSAAWVAARGAAVGAAKWGIASAVLGGAGYVFSPIYRGLTIQFKVFLQMSGMIFGSIVEADRRLIAHEQIVRAQKRLARDAEVWRRYEEEFEELGTPGVGAESKVSNQSQQK